MKIIGSKQAELLARKKFGPKAYALRTSNAFEIGRFWGTFRIVSGKGKSWTEALRSAGIEIPASVNDSNVATEEEE